MGQDVFIDESWRGNHYVLAAVAIQSSKVASVRREVRLLAPRGSGATRRHFVRESENDRCKLLAAFRSLTDAHLLAYESEGPERIIDQRARCLDSLLTDLLQSRLSRLVLDHVGDAQRERDRRVLAKRLAGNAVSYGHEPAHSREPLLWLPDAVAWCVGRQGWRQRLNGWVRIHQA